MNVLEQFTQSKTGRPADNEDAVFAGSRYIAVIDGVTGKTDQTVDGRTGGGLAADLLCGVLAGLRGDEGCHEVFDQLQQALSAFSAEHLPPHSEVRLQASIVIYSVRRRQIWSLGDCRFRIGGRVELNRKKIDTVLADARAAAIRCLQLQGVPMEELLAHDPGRQLIFPLLKLQHLLENTEGEFGYSCLSAADNEQDPARPDRFHSAIRQLDVPPNTQVILASDGYPALLPTLAESEQVLAELLRKDPLCCEELRSTKGLVPGNVSFDDRAYVRFLTGENDE